MKKCPSILKNLVSMNHLSDKIISSISPCNILRVFCSKVECSNTHIHVHGKHWKLYCVCSKYVAYITQYKDICRRYFDQIMPLSLVYLKRIILYSVVFKSMQ